MRGLVPGVEIVVEVEEGGVWSGDTCAGVRVEVAQVLCPEVCVEDDVAADYWVDPVGVGAEGADAENGGEDCGGRGVRSCCCCGGVGHVGGVVWAGGSRTLMETAGWRTVSVHGIARERYLRRKIGQGSFLWVAERDGLLALLTFFLCCRSGVVNVMQVWKLKRTREV